MAVTGPRVTTLKRRAPARTGPCPPARCSPLRPRPAVVCLIDGNRCTSPTCWRWRFDPRRAGAKSPRIEDSSSPWARRARSPWQRGDGGQPSGTADNPLQRSPDDPRARPDRGRRLRGRGGVRVLGQDLHRQHEREHHLRRGPDRRAQLPGKCLSPLAAGPVRRGGDGGRGDPRLDEAPRPGGGAGRGALAGVRAARGDPGGREDRPREVRDTGGWGSMVPPHRDRLLRARAAERNADPGRSGDRLHHARDRHPDQVRAGPGGVCVLLQGGAHVR